eukprot:964889-Alexandrium_andersonii.AAC.1
MCIRDSSSAIQYASGSQVNSVALYRGACGAPGRWLRGCSLPSYRPGLRGLVGSLEDFSLATIDQERLILNSICSNSCHSCRIPRLSINCFKIVLKVVRPGCPWSWLPRQ